MRTDCSTRAAFGKSGRGIVPWKLRDSRLIRATGKSTSPSDLCARLCTVSFVTRQRLVVGYIIACRGFVSDNALRTKSVHSIVHLIWRAYRLPQPRRRELHPQAVQ